jgi:hypothetical protein
LALHAVRLVPVQAAALEQAVGGKAAHHADTRKADRGHRRGLWLGRRNPLIAPATVGFRIV